MGCAFANRPLCLGTKQQRQRGKCTFPTTQVIQMRDGERCLVGHRCKRLVSIVVFVAHTLHFLRKKSTLSLLYSLLPKMDTIVCAILYGIMWYYRKVGLKIFCQNLRRFAAVSISCSFCS